MAAKNDSLWNWLGRQIGHVKHAVKTDVTKPEAPKAMPAAAAPAQPAPQPQAAAPVSSPPNVIYREEKAEEVELPDRPGVKLRRTVIDEVIVDEKRDGQA